MLEIMVVDDSIIIRKTLTKILTELGHKIVAEAEDGEDALSKFKEHKPKYITMDITMPTLGGIETVEEILKEAPDTQIIMITSHGEEHLVMKAIKLGAKGYILKPIDKDKVIKAFSRLD